MPFTLEQKVLFRHCDPAGIVFYPRYFEMVNDCAEAFFCAIGTPFETLHNVAAIPTAQIAATFHAPSRHGDMLTLNLNVVRIGGSSLELALRAMCHDERRFSADATLVYVNAQGRPQRWPNALRTALSSHLSES